MKKNNFNINNNVNKRSILLIFALTSILFLMTGCLGGSRSGRSGELANYRTGTQGLEMRFLTNAPPNVVYAEDDYFPVSIEVRNRGVYPGERDGSITADIHFLGFDRDIIRNLDITSVDFDEEEAKTRYNPEGGYNVATVEASIDNSMFQHSRVDSYQATILAVVCYPYKTFVAEEVCINPNPNRNTGHNVCTPGMTGTGSQGAPIAVTSINSVAQRGRGRFVITISNVGGGTVIRTRDIGSCVDSFLDYSSYDKVTIRDARLSNGQPLDCSPSQEITLINSQATVVCRVDGLDENLPSFKTILQMELEYGYKKDISRTIQIRGN